MTWRHSPSSWRQRSRPSSPSPPDTKQVNISTVSTLRQYFRYCCYTHSKMITTWFDISYYFSTCYLYLVTRYSVWHKGKIIWRRKETDIDCTVVKKVEDIHDTHKEQTSLPWYTPKKRLPKKHFKKILSTEWVSLPFLLVI